MGPENQPEGQSRRVEHHPILGSLPESLTVTITVDGRPLAARAGEPILAALLADGYQICRTLPVSQSPRGLFCGVGRCPDCLMMVEGMPNVPTCVTPVRAGLRVETQQGFGQWSGEQK